MIYSLFNLYCRLSKGLDNIGMEILPLLARIVFALTLFMFFWNSALTKFGDGFSGLFLPSAGAYIQIFPVRFEAAGYDVAAMGVIDWAIVMAGTYGEVILPILIIIGLATRLAAFGMIAFILVLSIVDVTGHGVAMGSLFDGNPSSLIPDQRVFWGMLMAVLVFKGGGSISADALLCKMNQKKGT